MRYEIQTIQNDITNDTTKTTNDTITTTKDMNLKTNDTNQSTNKTNRQWTIRKDDEWNNTTPSQDNGRYIL